MCTVQLCFTLTFQAPEQTVDCTVSDREGPASGSSAIAVHLKALRVCDDIPSFGQLYGLKLAFPLILYHCLTVDPKSAAKSVSAPQGDKDEKKNTTMMQPERTDLDPPKENPFTQEQLKVYDGTDASKPVYVAIKGNRSFICPTPQPPLLLLPLALTLGCAYTYTCIFIQERFSTCHGSAKRTDLAGHTQY